MLAVLKSVTETNSLSHILARVAVDIHALDVHNAEGRREFIGPVLGRKRQTIALDRSSCFLGQIPHRHGHQEWDVWVGCVASAQRGGLEVHVAGRELEMAVNQDGMALPCHLELNFVSLSSRQLHFTTHTHHTTCRQDFSHICTSGDKLFLVV